MRTIKSGFCGLIIGLLLFAPETRASVLVDTGSPATTQTGAVTVCGSCDTNSSAQSVALQFSLTNSYDITSIQGFLWYNTTPGSLTLALYSDLNGLPGTQLYASQFIDDSGQPMSGFGGLVGWSGLSGINWTVSPGNYWASFEVRSGQTFFGALPFPAPIELQAAVKNYAYPNWNANGGAGGGLIVSGDLTPIPLPAPSYLLGSGLIGLFGAARRRKFS